MFHIKVERSDAPETLEILLDLSDVCAFMAKGERTEVFCRNGAELTFSGDTAKEFHRCIKMYHAQIGLSW